MKNIRIIFAEVLLLISITAVISIASADGKYVSVHAAGSAKAEYEYDNLGRVKCVIYPNGRILEYTYDANGNIKSAVWKKEENNTGDNTGGTENGTGKSDGKSDKGSNSGGTNNSSNSSNTSGSGSDGSSGGDSRTAGAEGKAYTAAELKGYNIFMKKRPSVSKLTQIKKTRYLKIKIKQAVKPGVYGETGYEVRVAANSKMKKQVKFSINRNKKKKYTSYTYKKKLKKGKTYYVKVRAYMTTVTGKKIYSRYSKKKSIKIK